VSPIFTILIVVIVIGFFLFPNILSSLKLKQLEEKFESDFDVRNDEILLRDDQLLQSLDNLQIKDENFKGCLRDEIGRYMGIHPDSRVSSDVVELIKSLNCQGRGVSSIDGVDNLKNVSHLDLSDNPLTSIRTLVNLAELKSLHLNKVRLKNDNELFALKYLNRLSPPVLNKAYCQDVEKWAKGLSMSSVMHIDSIYECKGGLNDEVEVSKLLAKQALGAVLSTEEEILVLEYKLNQQKKSYSEKSFKASRPEKLESVLVKNKQFVNNLSAQEVVSLGKGCTSDDCAPAMNKTKISYLPNNVMKACFARSSGTDGSQMIVKEGRIGSGLLAYSCYVPVPIANARSKVVSFKKECKQFVKSFLDCSDDIYNEAAIGALRKQFKTEPKVLIVKLDGVKNIAIELNH
jgi:hypothetical protein